MAAGGGETTLMVTVTHAMSVSPRVSHHGRLHHHHMSRDLPGVSFRRLDRTSGAVRPCRRHPEV